MVTTSEDFRRRVSRLRADLVEQGRRVQTLLEAAFDAFFSGDRDAAARVADMDTVIDEVDVQVERAAVHLLVDATRSGANLSPIDLRTVLTIVKINNELERIADAGVTVAEHTPPADPSQPIPETFRVIANSVVGILRDANRAFDRSDAELAKVVLHSDDACVAFKGEILRDLERRTVAGGLAVDRAFALHEVATQCELMESHCTNIAEQVLYLVSGSIVRHTHGHWVEVGEAK